MSSSDSVPSFRENRSTVLLGIAITVCFFLIYGTASVILGRTGVFSHIDVLFNLDMGRVVFEMCGSSGGHSRTCVHPIFVLLINPLGSLLARLLSVVSGQGVVAAAMIINTFFGSLGTGMAFVFFWLLSRNRINSLLLASLFGFSMSQFLLSSVPETSALAVCTLIFNYSLLYIGMQKKKVMMKYWLLAGVLSLGVTTTNFVQSLICFSGLQYFLGSKDTGRGSGIAKVSRQTAIFAVAAVAITVVLSLIQKVIYPSSCVFILPSVYLNETRSASLLALEEPIRVFGQILKHFFIINFISPLPDYYIWRRWGNDVPYFTLTSSWNYSYVGIMAVILWVPTLLNAIVQSLLRSKHPFFFFVMLPCIAFNMLLPTFYGTFWEGTYVTEYFAYTGNVTFCIFAFFSHYSTRNHWRCRALIISIIILMAVNNIHVILYISRLCRDLL